MCIRDSHGIVSLNLPEPLQDEREIGSFHRGYGNRDWRRDRSGLARGFGLRLPGAQSLLRPDFAVEAMSKPSERRSQSIRCFGRIDRVSDGGHDRQDRYPRDPPKPHPPKPSRAGLKAPELLEHITIQ